MYMSDASRGMILLHNFLQAAVFKYLYTCWEEYRNFTSGYYTPEEVECALDELQRQILESLAAQRLVIVHPTPVTMSYICTYAYTLSEVTFELHLSD